MTRATEELRAGWQAAALPIGAVLSIGTGAVLWLVATGTPWSQRVWMLGLLITGAPVVWRAVRGMLAGQFASDLVAMLAIVGAAAFGQPFAG